MIGDDYVKFGYNVGGERVYKEYKYYYRDICDGHQHWPPDGPLEAGFENEGDTLSTLELGGAIMSSGTLPPGDTLCIFNKTTYTRYIVSKGKILAEYSGVTGSSREFTFIYAGDQRIAMIDHDGKLHFYLNDHLGSARLVIDTSGTVKDKYDYYAFGEALDQTISTGQSYRYTGKPFDNDHSLNLHYYGARYYDGTTGRFISVDPLASKYPSVSPYVYTLNNPLRFIDENGDSAVVPPGTVGEVELQTALDMGRSGDLGPQLQSELMVVDALPFDVPLEGGDIPDTKPGKAKVGNTHGEAGKGGHIGGIEVKIDVEQLHQLGVSIVPTIVHEFSHAEDMAAQGVWDKGSEDEKQSETKANEAEKRFKKGVHRGKDKIKKYDKEVQQRKQEQKRLQNP